MKAIPAHSMQKLGNIVGKIPHSPGGVNGQSRGMAKAAEVRCQHFKIICQPLHQMLIENSGRNIAVEQAAGEAYRVCRLKDKPW